MSGRRARRPELDLRGRGYMPKGGQAAAEEHNARVRALAAVEPPEVSTQDGRTDVRASARLAGRPAVELPPVAALRWSNVSFVLGVAAGSWGMVAAELVLR